MMGASVTQVFQKSWLQPLPEESSWSVQHAKCHPLGIMIVLINGIFPYENIDKPIFSPILHIIFVPIQDAVVSKFIAPTLSPYINKVRYGNC